MAAILTRNSKIDHISANNYSNLNMFRYIPMYQVKGFLMNHLYAILVNFALLKSNMAAIFTSNSKNGSHISTNNSPKLIMLWYIPMVQVQGNLLNYL
jgi:hypothetical protein